MPKLQREPTHNEARGEETSGDPDPLDALPLVAVGAVVTVAAVVTLLVVAVARTTKVAKGSGDATAHEERNSAAPAATRVLGRTIVLDVVET